MKLNCGHGPANLVYEGDGKYHCQLCRNKTENYKLNTGFNLIVNGKPISGSVLVHALPYGPAKPTIHQITVKGVTLTSEKKATILALEDLTAQIHARDLGEVTINFGYTYDEDAYRDMKEE